MFYQRQFLILIISFDILKTVCRRLAVIKKMKSDIGLSLSIRLTVKNQRKMFENHNYTKLDEIMLPPPPPPPLHPNSNHHHQLSVSFCQSATWSMTLSQLKLDNFKVCNTSTLHPQVSSIQHDDAHNWMLTSIHCADSYQVQIWTLPTLDIIHTVSVPMTMTCHCVLVRCLLCTANTASHHDLSFRNLSVSFFFFLENSEHWFYSYIDPAMVHTNKKKMLPAMNTNLNTGKHNHLSKMTAVSSRFEEPVAEERPA